MHGRPGFRPILIALLAVLACLLTVTPGRAQEDATPLADLTIAVWPEFDQQAALVFYTGQVAADVPTPVEITFTLPDQATINAVAYLHDNGSLTNAEFSVDHNDVKMLSPNGSFHLEFYDVALQRNGDRRLYTLVWQSAHPVEQLTWEAQQPAGASSLTMTPGDATVLQDRFGLNVYQVVAGAIPAEQVATLTLSYDKPTPSLTVELLEGSEEVPEPPTGESIPVGLTAALIAVIVILAGVSVYFYTRFRRAEKAVTADDAPASPQPAPTTPAASVASSGFSPEAQAVVAGLTDREIEVLELLAKGLMNKEIGRTLGISPRTVARHRENMMTKLGLHSRTELVKFAIKIGLYDLEEG